MKILEIILTLFILAAPPLFDDYYSHENNQLAFLDKIIDSLYDIFDDESIDDLTKE